MTQLRKTVYQTLEPDKKAGTLSHFVDLCLIVLIAVNIVAVILETVASINARHHYLFLVIEVVSVAIFSVEYLARVWSSVENPKFAQARYPRLSYMMSPMALIDLLAILPLYLGYFIKLDLRFLRVLRLLRILKFTRYSSALSMLMDVFREESNAFFGGFFILIVMLVLASSGAYLAEHSTQPEKFGSIPAAMWWAVATLTTVGYGDVTPITPAGKLFGALVAIVGIGMAALPAGILASGMADRLRRTRNELADRFRAALADGVIDAAEEEELEAARRELGLSKRVADEIRNQMLHDSKATTLKHCPHCGELLHRP
ncbi:Potassium voltage-gated channel subfamily KQT; possible potassium channel, VIC family [hydrothermal vent metagenome]|uniref:Potassium voltage-gated channel subfamily KQT possible potassium channel, VIC family n=1 Tax=hydrothermal vent metagenome TaxID=652676 RepID=A0A3B0REA7_9ZZZZ